MMVGRPSRRTTLLAMAALMLAALTVYDQMHGLGGDRGKSRKGSASSATAGTAISAPAPSRTDPWRDVAQLRHYLAHATTIRKRYQTIAVPYAEAVATFATFYVADRPLRETATGAVRGLLPAGVEVQDLLVAEFAPDPQGIVRAEATISLVSADSQAMSSALLALGDAANGMIWKTLSLAADPERRRIQAKGQIAMVMLPRAE
jgi:hypothetical protein